MTLEKGTWSYMGVYMARNASVLRVVSLLVMGAILDQPAAQFVIIYGLCAYITTPKAELP